MKKINLKDDMISEWQRFCQTHYLPDNFIVNCGISLIVNYHGKGRLIE